MKESNEVIFEVGEYRTLPAKFILGRTLGAIQAYGSGQIKPIHENPVYVPPAYIYTKECLSLAGREPGYAIDVLRSWNAHYHKLGYFLQFQNDDFGERMKRLHSHTELASAILTSRLHLDEKCMWDSFDYLVGFKNIQEDYRADKNRDANYGLYASQLRKLGLKKSPTDSGRTIERATKQIELRQGEWHQMDPIHSLKLENAESLQKIKLFYSYSHADELLRNELEKHLSILQRNGFIDHWHDRRIGGGEDWKQQIDEHLKSAQIILLLISSDFLASDYCYDLEMEQALRQHAQKTSKVIPIFLRPCDWKGGPFGKLQGYPTDARPVTTWANQDEAFTNIAKGIRAAVNEILKRPEWFCLR